MLVSGPIQHTGLCLALDDAYSLWKLCNFELVFVHLLGICNFFFWTNCELLWRQTFSFIESLTIVDENDIIIIILLLMCFEMLIKNNIEVKNC